MTWFGAGRVDGRVKPGHDKQGNGAMTKWVYAFGDGKAEGKAEMRNLLGGKGANLAEMSNLGLPVPPGLTVTTEVCTYYYANNETYPPELKAQVDAAVAWGSLLYVLYYAVLSIVMTIQRASSAGAT